MTDRELIDAAVAAGKVRVIPRGVTMNHEDAALHALPPDVRDCTAAAVVLLALSDTPKRIGAIGMSVRHSRWPAGSMPHLGNAQIDRLLQLLVGRGVVEVVRGDIRPRDRFRLAPGAPKVDAKALRRKLKLRAEVMPIVKPAVLM